jgi:hypothetical protein
MAIELLGRLGKPLGATSAREVFALVAKVVPAFSGLDYRAIGPRGRALEETGLAAASEARA